MKKVFLAPLITAILALPGFLGADVKVKKNSDGSITVTHQKKAYIMTSGGSAPKRESTPLTALQARYIPLIRSYSRIIGFRPDIAIAVAKVESDFNPSAVSNKGAVGIMQLMKETARDYGVTNRYNPRDNIRAGIKHLKFLYEKYRSNLDLTLAAYNAGVTRVTRYKGVPPFPETRRYIQKVRNCLRNGIAGGRAGRSLYKYRTADGRIVITDRPPSGRNGKVKILDSP